eukprot:GHVU01028481.1.p6 GENE.GHVU01028481.1~~GHVU01028481.1.p6  ORF type:complete len:117 (+),score=6.09 GHVU01028481.1:3411-3761(+)
MGCWGEQHEMAPPPHEDRAYAHSTCSHTQPTHPHLNKPHMPRDPLHGDTSPARSAAVEKPPRTSAVPVASPQSEGGPEPATLLPSSDAEKKAAGISARNSGHSFSSFIHSSTSVRQ